MSDNKLMHKIVNNLVEQTTQQPDEVNNFKKILPSLIEKGIDNINLSMFNEETKKQLLAVLGDEYARKGRLNDAIKAYILAGDRQKLIAIGDDYQKLGLFS